MSSCYLIPCSVQPAHIFLSFCKQAVKCFFKMLLNEVGRNFKIFMLSLWGSIIGSTIIGYTGIIYLPCELSLSRQVKKAKVYITYMLLCHFAIFSISETLITFRSNFLVAIGHCFPNSDVSFQKK